MAFSFLAYLLLQKGIHFSVNILRRGCLGEEGDKNGKNEITKHPCCPFILDSNEWSGGSCNGAKAITNI